MSGAWEEQVLRQAQSGRSLLGEPSSGAAQSWQKKGNICKANPGCLAPLLTSAHHITLLEILFDGEARLPP